VNDRSRRRLCGTTHRAGPPLRSQECAGPQGSVPQDLRCDLAAETGIRVSPSGDDRHSGSERGVLDPVG
jgi:hypothetical protein